MMAFTSKLAYATTLYTQEITPFKYMCTRTLYLPQKTHTSKSCSQLLVLTCATAELREATALAKSFSGRMFWPGHLYLTPDGIQQNRLLAEWDVLATILQALFKLH